MILLCLVLAGHGAAQTGQATRGTDADRVTEAQSDMPVLRTEGPDQTIASFILLRAALKKAVTDYLDAPSWQGVMRIDLILANLRGVVDLESVPAAGRQRIGDTTMMALLDVFARIDLPEPSEMPTGESFDDAETAAVRLPGTPLRLIRIDEGNRAGEWLFDDRTVITAPRFLAGLNDVPPRAELPIESWSRTLPQLAGPLIPYRLTVAIPESLQTPWSDVPIWKEGVLALATALAGLIIARINRWTTSALRRGARGAGFLRVTTPVLVLLFLQVLLPRLSRELMPFSQIPEVIAFGAALLSYVALAWLFWSALQALIEARIGSSPQASRLPGQELLRVTGLFLGSLGVIVIATIGAQRLGIPVLSLAAGLGIGGLAVALAVRPTLENLVGGILLYVDRPVRIGDFCTFGQNSGTVERIGIRAVKVRALDRTLISIPNARFADMDLVNWAACDMMLIHRVMRLRLETTADQLRFVLAEIRKMLHAHPRIDDDTIRVRYVGPNETGREIDLRFYVKTREWNEFFAIREDAFLRVDEVLDAAGARYAVPAQVVHVGPDPGGTDPDLRHEAEAQVAAWRQTGSLPFPKFSSEELADLDDTLDYPPKGSPDAGTEGTYRAKTPEKLSQEPMADPDDPLETDR